MKQEVLETVVEKTRELIEAPTCSRETKEAAQRWLDAVGTAAEKEETLAFIKELEEDIMPIETLIQFAQSEKGAAYFGAEKAAGIAAMRKRSKRQGRAIATVRPVPLPSIFWSRRTQFWRKRAWGAYAFWSWNFAKPEKSLAILPGLCYTCNVNALVPKEVTQMKEGIHPKYSQTTITCACGEVIETGSTKENIRVEICSKCHPFFTGKQKLVDTGGRVDRFNKRFGRTEGK